MFLAKVIGTVIATQKYETLNGLTFKVIQPCDDRGINNGEPVIACDPMSTRSGDMVMFVKSREASLAVAGAELVNMYPIDAAITGLVDQVGDVAV